MEIGGEGIREIPYDVLFEILTRLPVKSLLRFRSVCKSWNALISNDSQFIKSQLQQSKCQQLLVDKSSDLFTLPDRKRIASDDWWKKFDPPLDVPYKYIDTVVLCACDGLILFRVVSNYPAPNYWDPIDNHFILWNPSIRKYRLFSYSYATCRNAGFGVCYDPLVDSYKVLVLLRAFGTQILVYNVTTQAWSTVDERSYYILTRCGEALANGLLHWVCKIRGDDSPSMAVVYFDLLEARFKEVPQPDYDDGHGQFDNIGLAVLKGRLCICSLAESKQEIKVWVRKESWTNLFVIPFVRVVWFWKVYGLTEKGELVLDLDKSKLVLYSPSETTRYRTLSTSTHWSVITHAETLVLMNVL